MTTKELAAAMREQSHWCQKLGSPLYDSLLRSIIGDLESDGVCARFLGNFQADPPRSLLPLRFLAMLHKQAISGALPELARCYPTCGGAADPHKAFQVICDALEQHGDKWVPLVPARVQTNEVNRCCALYPGFSTIAHQTGLPLRTLEIGCSAGLNLSWDRFCYQAPAGSYGDEGSRLIFQHAFTGSLPPRVPILVTERRGCDLAPVPLDEDGRSRLLSFVWADQSERFAQIDAAIAIARQTNAPIDEADALHWTEHQLSRTTPGVATVVFHSIVLLYLSKEDRARFEAILSEAGQRATSESPLAWLSMEAGETETDVLLTIWPGGRRTRIARAGFHGKNVELQAVTQP